MPFRLSRQHNNDCTMKQKDRQEHRWPRFVLKRATQQVSVPLPTTPTSWTDAGLTGFTNFCGSARRCSKRSWRVAVSPPALRLSSRAITLRLAEPRARDTAFAQASEPPPPPERPQRLGIRLRDSRSASRLSR